MRSFVHLSDSIASGYAHEAMRLQDDLMSHERALESIKVIAEAATSAGTTPSADAAKTLAVVDTALAVSSVPRMRAARRAHHCQQGAMYTKLGQAAHDKRQAFEKGYNSDEWNVEFAASPSSPDAATEDEAIG
jgi:hypothetical protein